MDVGSALFWPDASRSPRAQLISRAGTVLTYVALVIFVEAASDIMWVNTHVDGLPGVAALQIDGGREFGDHRKFVTGGIGRVFIVGVQPRSAQQLSHTCRALTSSAPPMLPATTIAIGRGVVTARPAPMAERQRG